MSKSAQKILETAEKLFYQNSFFGVGVDLIRDESGCSKTTMYTYYKNKNQLVEAVLITRDVRFRQDLLGYIQDSTGMEAINKIFDWHVEWFKHDHFKGCLFVRAVAESNAEFNMLSISKAHKTWVKNLVLQHTQSLKQPIEMAELVYTLIEGLISRFLVEGFDEVVANSVRKNINQLLV